LREGDCGDVAVYGDGEPDEFGVVELRGELADVELEGPAPDRVWLGDAELADVELGVGDPEAAGVVTVNCSMATGGLPPRAG
jgi:hypothetical protein